MGAVISVNVGRPAPIGTQRGRPVYSGIGKEPVEGRIAVRGVNLDGDDQADRRVHGGPDKAVYAYATEDIAWWEAQLERPLGPAAFGENLTVEGVEVTRAVIGEVWRIGTTELQVCQPRLPCYKLGLKFGQPLMLKWFARAARPGAYLRILEEGEIGAGDEVEIHDRPAHGVTIATVNEAMLWENDATAAALAAPELPVGIAHWLRERAPSASPR